MRFGVALLCGNYLAAANVMAAITISLFMPSAVANVSVDVNVTKLVHTEGSISNGVLVLEAATATLIGRVLRVVLRVISL